MKSEILAVAAMLFALAGPAPAHADEPAAPSNPAACDYFENALIGTRCAGTFAVGAGLSSTMRKVEADNADFTFLRKTEWLTPFGFVRVTPTSWLTLGFTSEYTDFDTHYRYQPAGSAVQKFHGYASFADRQIFTVNANVIDTGPAASRYVVNLFAGDSFVPAHDGGDSNNYAFAGYTSGAKWQLGQAGYSLNAFSSFEANFNTDVEFVRLFSTTRLLLSNDALGIGAGPVFSSAYIASGSASGFPKDAYSAGLEVIAQPFKDSSSVFLAGLVLDASVKQSIGQAGFVSDTFDARETVVEGSMRYNFKY